MHRKKRLELAHHQIGHADSCPCWVITMTGTSEVRDNWNQHKEHSVEYKKATQYKDAKKAPGKKKKRPQITPKGG
jgi:hypothetical protein